VEDEHTFFKRIVFLSLEEETRRLFLLNPSYQIVGIEGNMHSPIREK